MDTDVIKNMSRATVDGSLAFPEIVRHLIMAGVESYLVDYVNLRTTYYGADGGSTQSPIPFDDLPPVAESFSDAELKSAILDSQRNGQHFHAFSRRAKAAGVQSYMAFLRGRRVTYWGRQGDQHTEWFPGARPASTT
jgi:uncharacterized protein YbcV (DUF1398 family)